MRDLYKQTQKEKKKINGIRIYSHKSSGYN